MFLQHLSESLNLPLDVVASLLDVFSKSEFVGPLEDFEDTVRQAASDRGLKEVLTTLLYHFYLDERAYLLKSIELLILYAPNPEHAFSGITFKKLIQGKIN